MPILKDSGYNYSGCELEITINPEDQESINYLVNFRYGNHFPEVNAKFSCLRSDFKDMLSTLVNIESITTLRHVEAQDPGLSFYYIPESPRDQIENTLFKLIFLLDAGECNKKLATETGPAMCLLVTKEQISTFVQQLINELSIPY